MEKKWEIEYLSNKPENEFEKLNDSMYIQRVEIEETMRDDCQIFVCKSRKISLDEYLEIMERKNEIRQVVLETTNTAAYEEGYRAAMILLGGEE